MISKHYEKKEEKIVIDEEKKRLIVDKKETYEDDNECTCSCRDLWNCIKSCCDNTYICIRTVVISIKKCVSACFGYFCFPIKERFCNCCDNIDRDLNPYKNPHYNPYDHL